MDALVGHTLCERFVHTVDALGGHTLWTHFVDTDSVDTLDMQPADTDPVIELIHTHVGHGSRTNSVDMPRGQADTLCAHKLWK